MTVKLPRRVLIVGAKFGEIYANAFLDDLLGIELAGIMANGSHRARKLAHAFGVPLYTRLEDLPENIDIACVVVRSTIIGGHGSRLAESLLNMGMHVVQEHPVHPEEVQRLQRLAQEKRRIYWVNSFYSMTTAGQVWIKTARNISRRVGPPEIATVTTSRQLLYSSLDFLLQASNLPIHMPKASSTSLPGLNMDMLRLSCDGTDITLSLQNYIDPQDPDMHSLVMHHMMLGWKEGHLSLISGYGPVIWTGNWFDPTHLGSDETLFDCPVATRSRVDMPACQTLHNGSETWRQIYEHDAPASVRHLLKSLCSDIDRGFAGSVSHTVHQHGVAALWQSVLQLTGPAHERNVTPPEILHLTEADAKRCEWEAII